MQSEFGLIVRLPAEGDDENEANARLIAAAPEMLEALQAATWLILKFRPMGSEDEVNPVLSKAHAAIAKAEGSK